MTGPDKLAEIAAQLRARVDALDPLTMAELESLATMLQRLADHFGMLMRAAGGQPWSQ